MQVLPIALFGGYTMQKYNITISFIYETENGMIRKQDYKTVTENLQGYNAADDIQARTAQLVRDGAIRPYFKAITIKPTF